MKDTCIVTCYYTKLHGTKFGGRKGLDARYRESLVSLLKITDADFYIYCDPQQKQELIDHLDERVEHWSEYVTLVPHDLDNFYLEELFAEFKDYEHAKKSDRCKEIQYNKIFWMKDVVLNRDYEYCFWIDIGISHSGLLPDKFMIVPENRDFECFNNTLFSNGLIRGMKKYVEDKFLIFAIHNSHPMGYRPPIYWYNVLEPYHTIGGFLGGKKRTILEFYDIFKDKAYKVASADDTIYDEEVIYNIIWQENPEFFADKKFETWYHEDNIPGINGSDEFKDKIRTCRPFYHILVELNDEHL
jgi:hypothetical protein